MPDALEMTHNGVKDQNGRPAFADMGPLIRRVREFLEAHKEEITSYAAPVDLGAFTTAIGLAPRRRGRPEVILAEDTAVELGHPSTTSRALVLITTVPELVRDGHITLVGPDLAQMVRATRCPFAQIVMLAPADGGIPDPFEIENTQYLTHRLPGYMVRSVPGRLWARISKRSIATGLTLQTIGSALIAAYRGDFACIERVEVVFVTSSESAVDVLAPIAGEASILSGRHKKLVLTADGGVECTELACETCEEKPVCDNLRDVVIKRRSRAQ
jgi:CO dehydrogenase/acetyl-CoA synthase beta subunit